MTQLDINTKSSPAIRAEWSRWIWQVFFPAVVVGMFSVAFSTGVYVGRNEVRVELVSLEERLHSHENRPIHSGAAMSDTIDLRLGEILRRLDRIERQLEP